MTIVILGLSITSSWGNGHASTYRALSRALAARGHDVVFLERNAPWYAENRDLPSPSYCRVGLYEDLKHLESAFLEEIHRADLVVVGSYVPEGTEVGDLVLGHATGVTAFYDIDTPVTLARIDTGVDYLAARQIPAYDLYLSFTGGPMLDLLRERYGARDPRPLYCSVDPDEYRPDPTCEAVFDLGYLGTYSDDRQPVLDRLLLQAAARWRRGRFAVVGPQYPAGIAWPANVERNQHLAPDLHRGFYTSLRYTLNVTRRDMVQAGYSPSVRLFEASACGTPIISDEWRGIGDFFVPNTEILLSNGATQTLEYLRTIPEDQRIEIGQRARARVLGEHTSAHRAEELEAYVAAVRGTRLSDAADAVEPGTDLPVGRLARTAS